MSKGIFIVMEGIDGCGKTTQVQMLARRLRDAGRETVVTREPGGTRIGGRLRKMLLDPANGEIMPRAEALLYAADRAQHVEELILPAVRSGKFVLCDRFTDSTLAYQGGGRGMDKNFLVRLNGLAAPGLSPDLVFILDVPPEVAVTRQGKGAADRLEAENVEFHRRVRDAYLALARAGGRYRIIDAGDSPGEVHRQVWEQLEGYCSERL